MTAYSLPEMLSWQVFDVRSQKCLMTYKGHTRDVTSCTWHPMHEELFSSGSLDGALFHWLVSRPEPQLQLLGAHDREVSSF
jgi:polyadenylation factor subunit 2